MKNEKKEIDKVANIQIWRNMRIQNLTAIFTINHILADTIYSRELRTI